MKTKSWKKYMCLMGISLMMMPAVCAMQTAEGGMGTIPLKKRVALLLLVEKRRGNPQEKA